MLNTHLTDEQSASLTAAQKDTIAFVRSHARETGASVTAWVEPEGELYVQETASAEWDNMITIWRCHPSGDMDIL